jgi:hypothetical protein
MGKEAKVPVNPVLLKGYPTQEILNFAEQNEEQNDIDMIIMGTEGKTGVDRFFLGGHGKGGQACKRRSACYARALSLKQPFGKSNLFGKKLDQKDRVAREHYLSKKNCRIELSKDEFKNERGKRC